MIDYDHEQMRKLAEKRCAGGYGKTTTMLARWYLETAPDPDADLIDEDPLPDGWAMCHSSNSTLVKVFIPPTWATSTVQILGHNERSAIREAWRLHHGF